MTQQPGSSPLAPDDIGITERFTHSTVPMVMLALDGEVLVVNDAHCRLVAMQPEQLVGRRAHEFVVEETDRDVLAANLRAADGGQRGGEFAQSWRTPGPAGRRLDVRIAWSLLLDADDRPWYLTAICLDDTERAAADRRLAASEARWRSMLAHAADITWTADADGTIRSATSGVLSQLGWEPEQLVGRPPFGMVHLEDRPAFEAAWRRLVTGQTSQEVLDVRVPHSDGRWLWVQETLTDLRDDPHVAAIVGNVIDVTARREAEAARVRHEARFRARFERSRMPQVMVDLHARLADVNAAFCELVGTPADELLGRPVQDLRHAQDAGTADPELARMLVGELSSAQMESTLVGPGGKPVPVLIDVTLLRDEHGAPENAVAHLHDLSTLRDAQHRSQQQEDFFLAMNARASDLALVMDADGRILYASPAVTRVLGHSAQAFVAVRSSEHVHPDDLDAARAVFLDVAGGGGTRTTVLRACAADGTWRHLEAVVANLLHTAVGGVVVNLRDITEQVEAERALRASEARYRAIADTAEEGMLVVTPQGRTLYANARMASILGVDLQCLYDPSAIDRLLNADGTARLKERLATRAARGTERYEVTYRHPDGTARRLWVAASPLHDADGRFEGSLAMVSDVTAARRLEEELRHAALHDSLTGLANRALLLDRLEHALTRRTDGTAVLFIDLDHFKLVNDSLGHGAGDELLVAVAGRLRTVARPSDTVARFGGDEFLVVCEDVDQDYALALAGDLLSAICDPYSVRDKQVHVGASIGVAVSPAESADDLVRYADTAMYSAKVAGRRRVRLFDRQLLAESEHRFALSASFQSALATDRLEMHYQPVVELTSGAVLGMEALARWHDPERGAVPPNSFVPLAEELGLAPQLDRWALTTALRDASALRACGALPPDAYVAVNLSARNLADEGLEAHIARCAEQAGFAAQHVVLEITESAIMSDTSVAISMLRRLRARGFQVAVDDFGTGYSSLAYLRDLPITSVKVDRSFVTDITTDPDALAIVSSIVELARATRSTVVAEGVETAEHAALLRTLGCRAAQGWLWSPAQAPAQVRADMAWRRGFPVPPAVVTLDAGPPRPSAQTAVPIGPQHGLAQLQALHAEGASPSTIAAALNQQGYRAPSGARWHRNSVARVTAQLAAGTAVTA